jgi:putative phosphoesterase
MRIGVISDTHLPRGGRSIPPKVHEVFDGAELILHAGDLVSPEVLEELEATAPVQAVRGNMDLDESLRSLPQTWRQEVGGVEVAMIHDAGPSSGRLLRLGRRFPGARVVVFGHSHRPLVEDDGSMMLLNPGSACDPRGRAPTVAVLDIEGGKVEASLVEVD